MYGCLIFLQIYILLFIYTYIFVTSFLCFHPFFPYVTYYKTSETQFSPPNAPFFRFCFDVETPRGVSSNLPRLHRECSMPDADVNFRSHIPLNVDTATNYTTPESAFPSFAM